MGFLLNPYRFAVGGQVATLLNQGNVTTSTTSYTANGVDIGAESATRQFWAVTVLDSSVDRTCTASLGGNAMTLRSSHNIDGSAGDIDIRMFSLDGLTTGTTANFVVTTSGGCEYSIFLIRLDIPVGTTPSDSGTTTTEATVGAYNHTMTIVPGSLILGGGSSIGSGGTTSHTLVGMDDIVYSNAGDGTFRRAMGFHLSETSEDKVVTFNSTGTTGIDIHGVNCIVLPPL